MEYNLKVTVEATRTIRGSQTREVQSYVIHKDNVDGDQLEDIRQHLEEELVVKEL